MPAIALNAEVNDHAIPNDNIIKFKNAVKKTKVFDGLDYDGCFNIHFYKDDVAIEKMQDILSKMLKLLQHNYETLYKSDIINLEINCKSKDVEQLESYRNAFFTVLQMHQESGSQPKIDSKQLKALNKLSWHFLESYNAVLLRESGFNNKKTVKKIVQQQHQGYLDYQKMSMRSLENAGYINSELSGIASSSNRQDACVDQYNSWKNNTLPSQLVFELIGEASNVFFDPVYLADIQNDVSEGTTSELIRQKLPMYFTDGFCFDSDPRWDFDETKFTILYYLAHKLANKAKPDEQIVLRIYDDRMDILNTLHAFLRGYKLTLVSNVLNDDGSIDTGRVKPGEIYLSESGRCCLLDLKGKLQDFKLFEATDLQILENSLGDEKFKASILTELSKMGYTISNDFSKDSITLLPYNVDIQLVHYTPSSGVDIPEVKYQFSGRGKIDTLYNESVKVLGEFCRAKGQNDQHHSTIAGLSEKNTLDYFIQFKEDMRLIKEGIKSRFEHAQPTLGAQLFNLPGTMPKGIKRMLEKTSFIGIQKIAIQKQQSTYHQHRSPVVRAFYDAVAQAKSIKDVYDFLFNSKPETESEQVMVSN